MTPLISKFLTLMLMFWPQYVAVPFTHTSSAPITLVQKTAGAYGASSTYFAAAFTNNTLGNLAVVAVHWCSSGAPTTITSVTDTSTNSYTISAASLATVSATHYADCYTQFAYVARLNSFSGTNTVTASFPGGSNVNGSISLYEMTPGVVDQTNTGTNANTNVPTPGSITTTINGSFYIAAGVLDNGFGFGSGWFTAGSPFTLNGEVGGGNLNVADEYYPQTTAGAQAATFGTNYSGSTGPNAGSVITFHP